MLAEWRKAGGLGAALKWYKLMASDLMGKDDNAVAGRLTLELPVYFAGCARDAVCIGGIDLLALLFRQMRELRPELGVAFGNMCWHETRGALRALGPGRWLPLGGG